MGLFDLLFGSGNTDDYYGAGDHDRSQARADWWATSGGWHQPDPPTPGRDFNPWQDDDYSHGGQWWN
jgi:hypothetical protein